MKRTRLKKVSDKGLEKRKKDAERTKQLHLFFIELWNKLPRNKKCVICDTPLYGEPRSYMFEHLIEKSKRWDIAFEEWNMAYPMCLDCHTCKTNGFPKEKHKQLIIKAEEKDKQLNNN